jgi:large subunit ribosomal protein L18
MERKEKIKKRLRRKKRIRAKVFGTKERPRLSVFRSAKHIYAQLIDDKENKTLISASDLELEKSKMKLKKIEKAREVGKLIAKKAKNLKIEKVVFDRGGYKYHGRIKALAEGAREGGLRF